MRAKLCNLLNGITLIGLGVVLLDFFFTGRLDQYLHPQFRPWTLVGGVIFCLAGIIYAAATYDRPPVGVPGLLNSEFEALMRVSMGTARYRAARVRELLEL